MTADAMSKYPALLIFISIMLVACNNKAPTETTASFDTPSSNQVEIHQETAHTGHTHEHLQESQATTTLEVTLAPSELVVGPNRFAVGLFDGERRMVHEAAVHFHYYDLSNPAAPALESEADATPLHTPDGLTTIFVQEREFDRAGEWGVEVQAHFANGETALKRIGFEVLADSPTLKPGQKIPALDTPTASQVNGDLSQLSSASTPNPAFYQSSLAQAVANGKPTVLLFATPAFCQTRFCGPAYEVTDTLQKHYRDVFNFVHIEVYTGLPNPAANNWQVAPAMTAFGLTTEPWLYLIDSKGIVVYRVEGVFTTAEVERHLQALLGA
jgi:hypothetical protein